jgi:hypothetical protein
VPARVYRAGFRAHRRGHRLRMSGLLEEPERHENESEEDELLAPQEDKGYGEDEGEREESLPPE